jgi:hypothetical protein
VSDIIMTVHLDNRQATKHPQYHTRIPSLGGLVVK